jgi:hypothetical protein
MQLSHVFQLAKINSRKKAMRCLAIFASALLSANAYSASPASTSDDDFYKAYSFVSADGQLPIRNVVVKRVTKDFTSYRGFQFNCKSHLIGETGFYGSPDAALRELSTLKPSDKAFKLLTDEVWRAACGAEQPTMVSDSAQPPKAS